MLIFSLGFLAVALLAALLGFYSFAGGAVGIACAIFVFSFFAGSAMTLWQESRHRPAPPLM
jgi:uncharacterized membrane protein YtjA (UPF0391 family)